MYNGKRQFELHITSILLGESQSWSLYAVPVLSRENVRRCEVSNVLELTFLLSQLRVIGVPETILRSAGERVTSSNLSVVLGVFNLSEADLKLLGLAQEGELSVTDLETLLGREDTSDVDSSD